MKQIIYSNWPIYSSCNYVKYGFILLILLSGIYLFFLLFYQNETKTQRPVPQTKQTNAFLRMEEELDMEDKLIKVGQISSYSTYQDHLNCFFFLLDVFPCRDEKFWIW